MRNARILLCAVLLVLAIGCASNGNPREKLTPEQFIQLYELPGSYDDFWVYQGLKKGRHWIYHYEFRRRAKVELTDKRFVDANDMPPGFPLAPQPKPRPVNPAGLDSDY